VEEGCLENDTNRVQIGPEISINHATDLQLE